MIEKQAIKIRVGIERVNKEIAVLAFVFGEWAAHEAPNANGSGVWTLTHIPSGRGVPLFTEAQATAIARRVHESGIAVPNGARPSANAKRAIQRIISEEVDRVAA